MNENIDNRKIASALKWSAIAELLAKIISPITSMVLARLLTPDAFGIVASVTIIVSLCDLFTDIGCNKYIVQHKYEDKVSLYKSASVAFWTNLSISAFLWVLILIFDTQISKALGLQGEEFAIIVASLSLYMTAFSSVQMSILRKDLNFKKLFKIRFAVTLSTLIISVSLAYFGFSFWAIIIGNLCRDLLNAIFFNAVSTWKPSLYFSFIELKSMMGFSFFAFMETLVTWLKSNIAVLVLSSCLTSYMMGLYKTPITIDNSILGLLYSSIIPVLYSALSRVADDKYEFQKIMFRMQRTMAMIAFPMGVILLVFDDVVTWILLGNQWMEISWFVGIYGCAIVVENVFCIYCVEAYRAAGKPAISAITVGLNALILGLSIYFVRNSTFETICFVTIMNSLAYFLIQMVTIKIVLRISFVKIIWNVTPYAMVSLIIGFLVYCLASLNERLLYKMLLIVGFVFLYFMALNINPKTRKDFTKYISLKT